MQTGIKLLLQWQFLFPSTAHKKLDAPSQLPTISDKVVLRNMSNESISIEISSSQINHS